MQACLCLFPAPLFMPPYSDAAQVVDGVLFGVRGVRLLLADIGNAGQLFWRAVSGEFTWAASCCRLLCQCCLFMVALATAGLFRCCIPCRRHSRPPLARWHAEAT